MECEKVLRPRLDGQDTAIILAAAERIGFQRPEIAPGAQLVLGAEVRALDFVPKVSGLSHDAIDSEFVQEVERLVGSWPTYEAQVRTLLTAVYPTVTAQGRRTEGYGGAYGTRDHDVAAHFGQIYGTTDSPHVLSEGIVSSTANWKLYAMGVKTKAWDSSLVLNSTTDRVPAPSRGDLQPVGVTLHSMYAMHHILEWNLRVAEKHERWRDWAQHSVRKCHRRIQNGWAALDPALQVTSKGALFITEFKNWSSSIMEEATAWL